MMICALPAAPYGWAGSPPPTCGKSVSGFGGAAQNKARKKRLSGLAQSLDAHQIFGDFN
jgi:hypothetical protein